MDKSRIIEAIKRLAIANGGKPPGRSLFERETGIRMSDWYPHLWLRWGDALVEAGYTPNQLQTAISDQVLLHRYIQLTRDLGHLPVEGEIRRKARTDKSFPSHSSFTRLGGKEKLLEALLRYCQENSGYEDIIALCANRRTVSKHDGDEGRGVGSKVVTGFVYLMKSGRHYKIGRTNSVGSRERQLTIKIPVPPKTIHSIETDDPIGVETYWHSRFSAKRGEGEWFELSPEDIKAFKRWKRIV
ncbi:MAG TPA: GIY-YIG nuclease family protein [Candidatus Binatia bacterium]|jgi:hypothetical protein|nr:GIY-YIG nuclease family protein [Candidatus Binatia bacterium]